MAKHTTLNTITYSTKPMSQFAAIAKSSITLLFRFLTTLTTIYSTLLQTLVYRKAYPYKPQTILLTNSTTASVKSSLPHSAFTQMAPSLASAFILCLLTFPLNLKLIDMLQSSQQKPLQFTMPSTLSLTRI